MTHENDMVNDSGLAESKDRSDDAGANAPQLGGRAKRILLTVVGVAIVVVLLWIVYSRLYGQFFESTNDAQIRADSVTIAPRTNGYVAEVLVTDNQDVKAGQPLVRIDPRDYRASTAQAQAQVAVAEASVENTLASIAEQRAGIEQAQAQLAAARAKAAFDAGEVRRYTPLAASGAEPRDKLEQLRTTAIQSKGQADAQAAALVMQQRKMASIEAQVRQGRAQAQSARAQLDAAKIDLTATLVKAPMDGRVGDKTVNLGQYVQAGTRLMTLVPLQKIYVIANFKETQLARMRPGQPVTVEVDALDGAELHGRVASITPGTGAQFSLLPPQNATGNFTKIVQRVPVRIEIEAGAEARRLLVPGLSVTATVDTRTGKGAKDRIEADQKSVRDAKNGG
jgi:membrane fusion protein, multidrug efflux system